jgi:hypothetical protein
MQQYHRADPDAATPSARPMGLLLRDHTNAAAKSSTAQQAKQQMTLEAYAQFRHCVPSTPATPVPTSRRSVAVPGTVRRQGLRSASTAAAPASAPAAPTFGSAPRLQQAQLQQPATPQTVAHPSSVQDGATQPLREAELEGLGPLATPTLKAPATTPAVASPSVVVQHQQPTPTARRVVTVAPTPTKNLFSSALLPPAPFEPVLTVVFDLDETLVNNRLPFVPCAVLRPFVVEALRHLRRMMPDVEVVMWTASTRDTAAPVVGQLENLFHDVLFRCDSWFTDPIHTKDLRILGRDFDRVVIFDNAPSCVKLNPYNAVLVEDFTALPLQGAAHPSIPDASDDHTMVHVCRLIDQLAQGLRNRTYTSVSQGLRAAADSDLTALKYHYVPMPATWAQVSPSLLRTLPPLQIPPHGEYLKLSRLPCAWNVQHLQQQQQQQAQY